MKNNILDPIETETTEEIDLISTIAMIEIVKMIGINTPQKENTKDRQDLFLTHLHKAATKKEEITKRRRIRTEGDREAECDV